MTEYDVVQKEVTANLISGEIMKHISTGWNFVGMIPTRMRIDDLEAMAIVVFSRPHPDSPDKE